MGNKKVEPIVLEGVREYSEREQVEIIRRPYVKCKVDICTSSDEALADKNVGDACPRCGGSLIEDPYYTSMRGEARLVVLALNEGGYNGTTVDLEDLLKAVAKHFPELYNRCQNVG